MNEEQYEFDGSTYLLTKLPLGAAKEALLRLTQLGLFSGEDAGMSDVLSKLKVKDLDFFEDKMFGRYLQLMNDSGAWVPMGKQLTAKHFDGRLGAYMHMTAKALMYNFASFLDDLHIDALTGATEDE
jgi:hypothetical protein